MRRNTGFTLIELLIVIGVLGILAAGLLAAVDPFEQLKKGRDTNRRNIAVELNNALIRYYATHGILPFGDDSTAGVCNDLTVAGAAVDLKTFNGAEDTTLSDTGCLKPLIDDGELKADYVAGVGSGDMTKFFLYSETGVDMSICYEPESKSFYNDKSTKWNSDGTTNETNCIDNAAYKTTNPPGSGLCYWCAK